MGLGRIFGISDIKFVSSPETVELTNKDGTKSSLLEIARKVTPPCHMNPLIFNGHAQTAWSVWHDYKIPVWYKRKIIESDHPNRAGTFTVDFATPQHEDAHPDLPPRTAMYTEEEYEALGSDDTKPMLITLHGLSGGSDELYVRAVILPLVYGGGWEACVVNSRGCAQSKITSTILYNARATWDLRQTVQWLRKKYPNRPLFAVGYSLGANILTNYMGEEGENCVFKGSCLISNPWNLEISSLMMRNSFLRLHVYSKALGSNMKRLFER
jgi:predicted alpha/beta-fold hydrolase